MSCSDNEMVSIDDDFSEIEPTIDDVFWGKAEKIKSAQDFFDLMDAYMEDGTDFHSLAGKDAREYFERIVDFSISPACEREIDEKRNLWANMAITLMICCGRE